MGMFIVSALTAFTASVIWGDYSGLVFTDVMILYGASVFYVLYQIFVSKSYELGKISEMYPLTVLSPLFIPFWAFLLLGEEIGLLTGAGIVVAVIGAVVVKLEKLILSEFRKMFRITSDYRAARFAIAASLMYSFGSTLDKLKISSFDIFTYVFLLLGFMALNMVIYFKFIEKGSIIAGLKEKLPLVILGGAVVFLSFVFFRFALRDVMVSIAVPLRLMSVVFAILLGVFALKEKIVVTKVVGVAVVLAGVLLINYGLTIE